MVFLLIIFIILGELKAKVFRVSNETFIGPTVKINEEEYIQGSKIVVFTFNFTSSQAPKHRSNFIKELSLGFIMIWLGRSDKETLVIKVILAGGKFGT